MSQESVSESACLFPYDDIASTGSDSCGGIQLRCRRVHVERHLVSLFVAACRVEDLDPEALGLHIWPGTHVMAHVLLNLERRGELQGRSLLDLGCGTGFIGILARLAGSDSVVLADREARALEAAALNVRANGIDRVAVQAISWGASGHSAGVDLRGAFDILLLSEVLYVAQPLTVPWQLDGAEVASLMSLTKDLLRPGGVAWVTYGNREEGGTAQVMSAAREAGLLFTEVPLRNFVPAQDLEPIGAHALRRVQVFTLTHSEAGPGPSVAEAG